MYGAPNAPGIIRGPPTDTPTLNTDARLPQSRQARIRLSVATFDAPPLIRGRTPGWAARLLCANAKGMASNLLEQRFHFVLHFA